MKESVQRKADNLFALASRYIRAWDVDGADQLIGMLRARDLPRYFDTLDTLCERAKHRSIYEYQAYSNMKAFLSKNPLLADPERCDRAALSTWWKGERWCARSNRRLRLTSLGVVGSQYMPYLERARRRIVKIIGESPQWLFEGRHGPGASIGCSGIATSAPFKDAAMPYAVTPSCFHLFTGQLSFSEGWLWCLSPDYVGGDMSASEWFSLVSRCVKVVDDCNKMSFVPKNWKTSRTIGVEPLGNMYVQLGLGDELALKLRRVGIDIRDQSRNRELARQASLHLREYGDDYVTLDLSMASDTLSRELVKLLLPEKWYLALDRARCRSTVLPDGSTVKLSKFSSMGNGFTFPLETLIFYALAYAVVWETQHRGEVAAYGDDIIVPRGAALLLCEVFRWCGFVVNLDKSCLTGDFYESCGADYLRGHFVRPLYVKRAMDNVRDYIYLLNSVRKYANDFPYSSGGRDFYNHLLSRCGERPLFGPRPSERSEELTLIDTHIHTSARHLYRLRNRGWVMYYKRYVDTAVQRYLDDDIALIDVLRRGSAGTSLKYVTRDLKHLTSASVKITRSKVKWVPASAGPTPLDEIDKLIADLVRV